jgi:hypothetical protein
MVFLFTPPWKRVTLQWTLPIENSCAFKQKQTTLRFEKIQRCYEYRIYIINTMTNRRIWLSKIYDAWPNNLIIHSCAFMNYCVIWSLVVMFLQSISSISYSVYYINHICITSRSICAKCNVLFAFVWKRIRRNVNALAQNQQKITHVLQESLRILNVSRI